jgi:hypothetical protein
MASTWAEQRRRDDLSERIKKQEQNRDPEMEQAVVAFVTHRMSGGTMKFDDFRREWLKTKGAKNG